MSDTLRRILRSRSAGSGEPTTDEVQAAAAAGDANNRAPSSDGLSTAPADSTVIWSSRTVAPAAVGNTSASTNGAATSKPDAASPADDSASEVKPPQDLGTGAQTDRAPEGTPAHALSRGPEASIASVRSRPGVLVTDAGGTTTPTSPDKRPDQRSTTDARDRTAPAPRAIAPETPAGGTAAGPAHSEAPTTVHSAAPPATHQPAAPATTSQPPTQPTTVQPTAPPTSSQPTTVQAAALDSASGVGTPAPAKKRWRFPFESRKRKGEIAAGRAAAAATTSSFPPTGTIAPIGPVDPSSPAGTDPADPAARAPAGGRGRMRHRLRYLARARELMLRDLGGLLYEIHRTGDGRTEHYSGPLNAKVSRLAGLDAEANQLKKALALPRGATIAFEPGVGGTCSVCTELYGSDARYCSQCGSPVNETTPENQSPRTPGGQSGAHTAAGSTSAADITDSRSFWRVAAKRDTTPLPWAPSDGGQQSAQRDGAQSPFARPAEPANTAAPSTNYPQQSAPASGPDPSIPRTEVAIPAAPPAHTAQQSAQRDGAQSPADRPGSAVSDVPLHREEQR